MNRTLYYLAIVTCAGTAFSSIGVASSEDQPKKITENSRPNAVQGRDARKREPRPGDSWRTCTDARAAGTAPIYRGEPGYSEKMDRDGDGIACEIRP
ncbi:excalibur calcium-binding domain-containing protein [Sphingobium ummariense]|uniref:excalibur calcium-binding domain-containing protein n=1 Tax=Sphingobium ummariense TaxID=420994 RepID=UPI000A06ACE6|nr:excalibur calcium-binding domain-containing protein [Sphingobium ummariense]